MQPVGVCGGSTQHRAVEHVSTLARSTHGVTLPFAVPQAWEKAAGIQCHATHSHHRVRRSYSQDRCHQRLW